MLSKDSFGIFGFQLLNFARPTYLQKNSSFLPNPTGFFCVLVSEKQ